MRHPSPATILATGALVLAGTGTAAATSSLIDGKSIRNGSITAAKLHRGTLTARQIAPDTLTGTQIRESSLGQVPRATFAASAANAGHASRADTAGRADTTGRADSAGQADSATTAASAKTAGHADTADAVNGTTLYPFNLRIPAGTGATTAFNAGHLRLYATCSVGASIDVYAASAVDHAQMYSYGSGTNTNDPDFTTAADHQLSSAHDFRSLVYATRDGRVVSVQYEALSQISEFDGSDCVLAGTAAVK